MKKVLTIAIVSLLLYTYPAASQNIHTEDVSHFWAAYDSIKLTQDSLHPADAIQRIFLNQSSVGMVELIKIRGLMAGWYASSIKRHPLFWASVRPKTEHLRKDSTALARLMDRYRKLYPAFKVPDIYFTISPIMMGGTTTQDKVLIGTEIGVADSTVNSSELGSSLRGYMRTNKGVSSIVAHELTHTQQKGGDMEDRRNTNLLGFCLAEGMCDFMAGLLLNHPPDNPYIAYGKAHEDSIWTDFKRDMNGKNISQWLYNGGGRKSGEGDLGYFVGYAICMAYYNKASDKTAAIKHIITLDLEDTAGLSRFVDESGYNGHRFAS